MSGELLFFAICFIALALILLVRVIAGPTIADRAIAADCVEVVVDAALILFSLISGRSIFLDIALVTAVLGFIGTTLIGRYLGGEL
ncbi:MAG: cation:proton antiporter [Lachnospiraceae bacterium]|nr:cation:proton antiporter [Lachnospiraceae bacterium]